MSTAIFTHQACFAHDVGQHHPESPKRLKAVLDALDDDVFNKAARHEAPRAERDALALIHPPAFVDAVLRAIPASGHAAIDADTIVSPGSGEAALRAAGAVCAAVDAVMAGDCDSAFCAVRPPGHHAEPDRAMGFCLFNNVAIGAAHARGRHGRERIAVIDFDVHHGNGTQAAFAADASYFYASTHQMPLYPGTGAASETGVGNIVNAPLAPHAGSREFRRAFEHTILPALDSFRPQFVLISAGFDAHKRDPLAQLELDETDFAWVTARLREAAKRHADGHIVSSLEGGYDLPALAASAAAHVAALMAG